MVMNMVGYLLILLSCWALGEQAAGKIRLHQKRLKQLKSWLSFFRGKLMFEGATVEEALKESAEIAGAPFFVWLNEVSEQLMLRDGRSFMQIWDGHLERHGKRWGLAEAEITGLKQFGSHLGQMDREQQARAVCMLEECLDEGIQTAEKEIQAKEKLYRSLGILAGCMIIILIW